MDKQKLICSKCKHTRFLEGTALVLDCIPLFHKQEYICENCGSKEYLCTLKKVEPQTSKEVHFN